MTLLVSIFFDEIFYLVKSFFRKLLVNILKIYI